MKIDFGSRTFTPHGPARLRGLTGMPLASFRARAAAWFLDIFIIIALLIGLSLARAFFGSGPFAAAREGSDGIHLPLFEDPFGIALILLYFGLLPWLWNGRTPGKRTLGLRIVSLSRDRLTLWQCVERAMGYFFSSMEGGFGFIQYFLHPNRQTVHDRIAETVVIREIRREQFQYNKKHLPNKTK
ncbi:RDD family protein [bacterium]|nr:RDD family protein [bacterium]